MRGPVRRKVGGSGPRNFGKEGGRLEVTATLLHSGCLASVSSSDPKKENANCFHPIFVSHIRRPILGDFMICIETSRNGAWAGMDHNRLLDKVPGFVMSEA